MVSMTQAADPVDPPVPMPGIRGGDAGARGLPRDDPTSR
jgi:hypothetical protein